MHLVSEQQNENTHTWDIPDSNSSGFSPLGFTIFALELNMAFLQCKTTSQSPTATHLLQPAQPYSCLRPFSRTLRNETEEHLTSTRPPLQAKVTPARRGAAEGLRSEASAYTMAVTVAQERREPHVRPNRAPLTAHTAPCSAPGLRARPRPPPRGPAASPQRTPMGRERGGGGGQPPAAPSPQLRAPRAHRAPGGR